MGSSIEEVREAKEKAKALLKSVDSVVGVGLEKVGAGYRLKVNLRKPLPSQSTPLESIDGVPVRFEVVGDIRKQHL